MVGHRGLIELHIDAVVDIDVNVDVKVEVSSLSLSLWSMFAWQVEKHTRPNTKKNRLK